MITVIRSAAFFAWMALTVIPWALAALVMSIFVRGDPLYWFCMAWLRLAIWGARVICGVHHRVQGMEHLPAPDALTPVILCPKHQSTWETFAFPTLMSHPLAYVFKKELLHIPFFGWAIGRLDMIHIDRSQRAKAFAKVVAQGQELLARGARLEWLPLEALCYSGCLAENRLTLDLADGAEMIGWDLAALGLPNAGQPFERGHLQQHLQWPGRWLERARITADDARLLDAPLGWAGHRVLGTLWLAGEEDEPTLEEFHPAGTTYWSAEAPIALAYFPANRSQVWRCRHCGRRGRRTRRRRCGCCCGWGPAPGQGRWRGICRSPGGT